MILRRTVIDALSKSIQRRLLTHRSRPFLRLFAQQGRGPLRVYSEHRQLRYVLCLWGHGNYSFCLIEALTSGRDPVLVAGDCILRFDFF
jgi:hypothetical protein